MSLLSMIKNLIKNGLQKKIVRDTGKIPDAQCAFMGQTKNVKNVTPYGFYCSPVIGSQWVIFSSRANSDDLQGIGNDYENRPKNLLTGELILQNLLTGAFAKFDALGNINVFAPTSVNVTSPIITATATTSITATAPLITATATTSAVVTTPLLAITATTTNIVGNVNITGVLTVNGVNHNDHVHKENDVPNDTDSPKNP